MAISDTGGTVTAWKGTGSVTSLLSALNHTTYSMGYAGIEGRGNLSRSSDFKAGRLVGGPSPRTKSWTRFQRYQVPLGERQMDEKSVDERNRRLVDERHVARPWRNSALAGAYRNGTAFNDSEDAVRWVRRSERVGHESGQ